MLASDDKPVVATLPPIAKEKPIASKESTAKKIVAADDKQQLQQTPASGAAQFLLQRKKAGEGEVTIAKQQQQQQQPQQQHQIGSTAARFLFLGKKSEGGGATPHTDVMAKYKEKLRLEAEAMEKHKAESKKEAGMERTKKGMTQKNSAAMQGEMEKLKRVLSSKLSDSSSSPTRVPADEKDISVDRRQNRTAWKEVNHDNRDAGAKGRKERSLRVEINNGRRERLSRSNEQQEGVVDGEDKKKRRLKLPKKGMEITLPLTITVDGLAKLLDVPNDHMLRNMQRIGMDKLASNYILSNMEAADIALEYNVVPIIPENKGPELYPRPIPEDMSGHPVRPPVVTIMGHVDHGKTTLLDTLRSSSITATEAGGITQHIGAFSVKLKGGQNITFLDTPGHAAFSAMRARGANATDIVVLVVAVDDGVMPQTKEAIQHALDADAPIIVAINKCDKPGVDPSAIHQALLKHGIQTEELGGDIQAVEISALKGTGVDDLAESIVTLAEVLDLRSETDIPAHATVIESQLEKGRGSVASVLVKRGTLKTGDVVVAGTTWCKVRSMTDDRGKAVSSAGPACAVRVMGWKEIPRAGDMVLQAASEQNAKEVVANRVEKRSSNERLVAIEAMNKARQEDNSRSEENREAEKAFKRAAEAFQKGLRKTVPTKAEFMASAEKEEGSANGQAAEELVVPLVIKGDVSGTVEAVSSALKQLPSKKIRINVIGTGVGPVTESDVTLAGTGAQGVVIAFNVKADKKTLNVAKRQGVEVKTSRIIYKLLEEVEEMLIERLPPVLVEGVQGEAIVQQTFDITLRKNSMTNVAGCRVTTGKIARTNKVRVKRGDSEVFAGEIGSLKNAKHNITEATKGQEFGISFEKFEDVRVGDIIQSLHYSPVPQKLE
ncbi:translation initiation factor IF-2 [Coemansia sp. RSA 1933]|nr:translation initiation factor IF-2 [Coemansia sp. RSA 1933]